MEEGPYPTQLSSLGQEHKKTNQLKPHHLCHSIDPTQHQVWTAFDANETVKAISAR